MKILEEVRHRVTLELPQCKSHGDVLRLFTELQEKLLESKAPLGQRRHMWEEIKGHLSNFSRRPDVINDAHATIDGILKRIV